MCTKSKKKTKKTTKLTQSYHYTFNVKTEIYKMKNSMQKPIYLNAMSSKEFFIKLRYMYFFSLEQNM